MLYYENTRPALEFVFHWRGSVLPQAMFMAIPNAITCYLVGLVMRELELDFEIGNSQAWTGYNAAVGFLLLFRTQTAYARWWEGGSLLQQARGEWYNAVSSLVAFCDQDPSMTWQVDCFQHLLVRLMSMMHCSALQQVAMMEDASFEIIDTFGIDDDSLEYLQMSSDRCEVLLQWIQRHIVNNMHNGVLNIPAPVISRVFQELSRGIVNLINARKVKQFPFPFPFAQTSAVMILMHWIITPIANSLLMKDNPTWAIMLTFVATLGFWSIHYIAIEIEMPFGDDANDLPIPRMQREMNRSLLVLLEREAQKAPSFEFQKAVHERACFQKASIPLVRGTNATVNLATSWGAVRHGDSNESNDFPSMVTVGSTRRKSVLLRTFSPQTIVSDLDAVDKHLTVLEVMEVAQTGRLRRPPRIPSLQPDSTINPRTITSERKSKSPEKVKRMIDRDSDVILGQRVDRTETDDKALSSGALSSIGLSSLSPKAGVSIGGSASPSDRVMGQVSLRPSNLGKTALADDDPMRAAIRLSNPQSRWAGTLYDETDTAKEVSLPFSKWLSAKGTGKGCPPGAPERKPRTQSKAQSTLTIGGIKCESCGQVDNLTLEGLLQQVV
mmetsp:Transcript_20566/g.44972  ORF Transcript_20566/g.44972 Transcript_20566/m.44972 type:complete len:610 (+) Transcript_20566:78-1907(+)